MSLLRPCPDCDGEGTVMVSCDEADYGSGCRCPREQDEETGNYGDRPHPCKETCEADGCRDGQIGLACIECGEDAAVIDGTTPYCSPCFQSVCSPGSGSPVEGQS